MDYDRAGHQKKKKKREEVSSTVNPSRVSFSLSDKDTRLLNIVPSGGHKDGGNQSRRESQNCRRADAKSGLGGKCRVERARK